MRPRRARLRCCCRRGDGVELVLAHVVVHLAPAGVDGGLVDALVEREAVLDRAAAVAAGGADGLAVGLHARGRHRRRFQPELVATGERGQDGEEDEGAAQHGRDGSMRPLSAAARAA